MGVAWLAYVDSEGNIKNITGVSGVIPEDGTIVNDLTIRLIRDTEIESLNFSDPAQFLDENFWRDNYWASRGPKPTQWYMWDGDSEWVVNTTTLLQEVRYLRYVKLSSSDWTQAVDAPLSDEKKAEWRTYRQSLRDIMANLPADLDDPENVVWPTEPS